MEAAAGSAPQTPAEAPLTGGADPFEVAAVWVEKGRKGSTQWVSSCTATQLRSYRLRKTLKPLKRATIFVYLGLAFVEVPQKL